MLLLCLLLSIGWTVAQTVKVSGTVISDEDGQPIIGAAVTVKGASNVGTVTDVDGKYALDVPSSAKTLVISYVGMRSEEIPVTDKHATTVLRANLALDEVVVTAMGISREKKALGYAVQDVKGDQLTQAANTNVASALQGKVSGIDIAPSSGMPGASSKMTIRGSRSFTGDNTPLYVVDGMPITSSSDIGTGNSVTGADYANRAVDIDPSDIESINILKGQAASALYGMRATNGVIVITTKSGKGARKGKPEITVNTGFSFENPSTLPKFQKEYAQGIDGKYVPTDYRSWGPKIADLANDPKYGGNTDNDYTKEAGRKPGQYYVMQRANAGLDPGQRLRLRRRGGLRVGQHGQCAHGTALAAQRPGPRGADREHPPP